MRIFGSRTFRSRAQFLLLWSCAALALGFPAGAAATEEPAHSPGWVVISTGEYRALRAKAFPAEREPEKAPLDACLTRVDYDLQVGSDLATGKTVLTVDVLKDGWVRVPVPAGLLVREARLEGKLLSLVPGPGGSSRQLFALLSHPGRAVLSLEVALTVTSAAGRESLSLPAADSGVTRALVQLPHAGMDVSVSGGLLKEKSESGTGSRWVAYGQGNESLGFTWHRRTEDHRNDQPLRLRGALTELVTLGEDADALAAEVNIEVAQGVADGVRLRLPDNITINQVQGAAVADWEMKDGELAVVFLEPVEHTSRFVLSGEIRLPHDGTVAIPLLRLLHVERDRGGVAVEVLGAGEIKDLKSQGLEEADAADLGEPVASRQSPALAAFRFRAGDPAARALTVNVARYSQQAVLMANVEEARYRVLLSGDGKALVQARYAIRNNQRNFLKIALPPGATVWSAALAGQPVKPGQAPDGGLLLPLEKARGGEDAPAFAVELVYFSRDPKWEDKGGTRLTLPELDLPVSRTGLQVHYPPLFEVTAEPGTFRTQVYEDPFSAALKPFYGGEAIAAAAPVVADKQSGKAKDEEKTQTLVDSFRSRAAGGRTTGIRPIRVSFPAFGPSLFLVSELTGANQSPSFTLNYKRDRKAGVR